MNTFTNLNGREDLLNSITELERELTARTGRDVALVAYSPVQYAAIDGDEEALARITELEAILSRKLGRDIALVAFSL